MGLKKYYINTDYLKFIYSSMLLEFRTSEITEFWKDYPLESDKKISIRDTICHIWNTKNTTSFEYVFRVLNDFEPFLLSKNRDIISHLEKYFFEIMRCTTIYPSFFMWILSPFFKVLFSSNNFYKTYFEVSHFLNDRVRPGSYQKLVKHYESDGNYFGTVLFTPDMTFTKGFTDIDGEIYFARTLRYSPLRFDAKPYDNHIMVSEKQTVFERIDKSLDLQIYENKFFLDGGIYGEVMLFWDFLKEKNIKITTLKVPDLEVVKILKDYFCPHRKRIILHKGCVYGAPVYLYTLKYKKIKANKKLLQELVNDISNPKELHGLLEQKHKEFISKCLPVLRIHYIENGYIIINDTPLTKGVPARILKKIIVDFTASGRCEFFHKEFISNGKFVSNPKNPGFVTRLNRLSDMLLNKYPTIRIVNSGRGKFKFEVDCKIDFSEE